MSGDVAQALLSAAPFKVAYPGDPAIDHQRCNATLYGVTRDASLLVERPGKKIVWFHLRPLRRSRVMELRCEAATERRVRLLAFCETLIQVDYLRTDDGTVERWIPPYLRDVGRPTSGGALSMTDLDLFSDHVAQDMGHVALSRACLMRGEPVLFPLLDFSALAIVTASYLRADETLDLRSLLDNPSVLRATTPNAESTADGGSESEMPGVVPVVAAPDPHTSEASRQISSVSGDD